MDKIFTRLIIPNIGEDVEKQKFEPCRHGKSQHALLAIPSKARDVQGL